MTMRTGGYDRGRFRHAPRRLSAVVAAAVTVLAGATACTSAPVDPTASCTAEPARPPGQPGSAEVLLVLSEGYARTVLYTDGWMVVPAGENAGAASAGNAGAAVLARAPMMAPPPSAGSRWQPAYLGECEVQAIAELAAAELSSDADLGKPMVTDASTTSVTYYGGDEPARTSAYALGHEDPGSELSRSDEHGREVLQGLVAALDEATLIDDVLPVQAVQVTGSLDQAEPTGWPGPPLQELLAGDECGRLTGQQARDVLEFLRTTDQHLYPLRARVVPPGMQACT